MNNKKRFDLAARTQKRIQEQNPYFRLIKRRDEIEKELKEKIGTTDIEPSMEKNKRSNNNEKNIFINFNEYFYYRV